MTQRELASAAAEDAFKNGLGQIFEQLNTNFVEGETDAVDQAKTGIEFYQKTFDAFKNLIQNLPN